MAELRRVLGVRGATVVGLGAMLGTGVFAAWTPAVALAGSALLLALLIAAVVAALNATSTAALARVLPQSGGAYAYGRAYLSRPAGVLAGYTFVLGKATQRMKDVFEIEFKAQSAALAAAKPGVPCEAVDAAARKVIVDAGFGPDYKYFSHRVGHGMGMDGHEWPYLVKGNALPLEAGMVFSDEPGIYIPGEFGIRLEDDMVITPSGAELFTPQSPSLERPF